MLSSSHDPHSQIGAGNAWYTDDQFAKQYDRRGARAVIENRWKVFERAIVEFFRRVEPAAGATPIRILDAGCGDGVNLLGLRNIVRSRGWNALIYGTDYNPLRVERASKLPFVEEIKLSSLDALPYPDGWFSVVLCNQVLEHIPQDEKVLLELKRVIQPGGMLILGVPNEGCALAWLRNHVIQRSILRTTDHVNFYTDHKLSTLLNRVGFEILKMEVTGFFTPNTYLHYLLALTSPGRRVMGILGRIWKSQSAELIAVCVKRRLT